MFLIYFFIVGNTIVQIHNTVSTILMESINYHFMVNKSVQCNRFQIETNRFQSLIFCFAISRIFRARNPNTPRADNLVYKTDPTQRRTIMTAIT